MEKIKAAILRTINNAKIKFGLLSYSPESLDSMVKKVLKKKEEYLSSTDVITIISNIINKHTAIHNINYSESLERSLPDEARNSICEEIIVFFDSIPRQYVISIRFPSLISPQQLDVKINKDITLQTDNPITNTVLSPLMPRYPVRINIRYNGYLNPLTESKFLSEFKQIARLGLDIGLFQKNTSPAAISREILKKAYPGDPSSITTSSYIFDVAQNEKTYIQLPDNLFNFLCYLEFLPNTFDKILASINNFKDLYKLLTNSNEHEAVKRIKTALEWGLESEIDSNETFGFIKKCIAIEALLGDGNKETGLTNRLITKCAYLLATTHKERKEISDNFRNLYRTRSLLVHGSKMILSNDEKISLSFASSTLKAIALKEISMLQ